MKILYISHKIPYPLFDGGRLRVYNHIKHLSKEHSITSLSFIENINELKNIDELKKICSVHTIKRAKYKSLFSSFLGLFSYKPLRVSYLKDTVFKKKVNELSKDFDIVIIQALRMSQYAITPEKTILDVVDTPSLQIERALKHDRYFWKMIWQLELPRILNYEKEVIHKFNTILVASEADKHALKTGTVLKNGIYFSKINRPASIPGNNIMFLGNMAYPPNIDAIEYFIKDIFPNIKRKIKNIKLFIVGINPEKLIKHATDSIVFTGFVTHPDEYFSKCKVFVAPLRLGSGIQNKVLEALNNEVPIITTSIVNQGINATPNKEIIIADTAQEFADKTVLLMQNKKLQKTLSVNGKSFLKNNFSWSQILKGLDVSIKID